jgi:hypothetical protein
VIARAKRFSVELGTPITPGSRLRCSRPRAGSRTSTSSRISAGRSRFGGRDGDGAAHAQNAIIGRSLIGTDNTARKAGVKEGGASSINRWLRDQHFYTRSRLSNQSSMPRLSPIAR